MRYKKGTGELNYSKGDSVKIKRFVQWLRAAPNKYGCVNPEVAKGLHCNSTGQMYLDWCPVCQVWAIAENLDEIAENRLGTSK